MPNFLRIWFYDYNAKLPSYMVLYSINYLLIIILGGRLAEHLRFSGLVTDGDFPRFLPLPPAKYKIQ